MKGRKKAWEVGQACTFVVLILFSLLLLLLPKTEIEKQIALTSLLNFSLTRLLAAMPRCRASPLQSHRRWESGGCCQR